MITECSANLDSCKLKASISAMADTVWEWTLFDTAKRFVAQKTGIGDKHILSKYKDAWTRAHRKEIVDTAGFNEIPVLLLAGVCWIEVGGDPDVVDRIAHAVRSFDHLGDPWLEPLTITKVPEQTSLGDVSIQLRRAAESLGPAWSSLSDSDKNKIVQCLLDEPCNVSVVGRHLKQLKQIDFPTGVGPEAQIIRVTGSRYNRGPSLSLDQILLNTSYGDFILKIHSRLTRLLA
jgi:hypothetical protein